MYSRMVDLRIRFWTQKHVQQQMASMREYDQAPGDEDAKKIRIHMPAGEMGSYRYARRNAHNGMALCARYGNPDFFITLTTNPLWPDISRQLLPGETWADRPDVVNSVFKHRLTEFLSILRGNKKIKFFPGKQVFIIRVIEWKKRGLPHCTCSLRLPVSSYVTAFPVIIRSYCGADRNPEWLRSF